MNDPKIEQLFFVPLTTHRWVVSNISGKWMWIWRNMLRANNFWRWANRGSIDLLSQISPRSAAERSEAFAHTQRNEIKNVSTIGEHSLGPVSMICWFVVAVYSDEKERKCIVCGLSCEWIGFSHPISFSLLNIFSSSRFSVISLQRSFFTTSSVACSLSKAIGLQWKKKWKKYMMCIYRRNLDRSNGHGNCTRTWNEAFRSWKWLHNTHDFR